MLPSLDMQQANGVQQSLQGPWKEDSLAEAGAAASRDIVGGATAESGILTQEIIPQRKKEHRCFNCKTVFQ